MGYALHDSNPTDCHATGAGRMHNTGRAVGTGFVVSGREFGKASRLEGPTGTSIGSGDSLEIASGKHTVLIGRRNL